SFQEAPCIPLLPLPVESAPGPRGVGSDPERGTPLGGCGLGASGVSPGHPRRPTPERRRPRARLRDAPWVPRYADAWQRPGEGLGELAPGRRRPARRSSVRTRREKASELRISSTDRPAGERSRARWRRVAVSGGSSSVPKRRPSIVTRSAWIDPVDPTTSAVSVAGRSPARRESIAEAFAPVSRRARSGGPLGGRTSTNTSPKARLKGRVTRPPDRLRAPMHDGRAATPTRADRKRALRRRTHDRRSLNST